MKVLIKDIVIRLQARVLHQSKYKYIDWVIASGLMSDVLTSDHEGLMLISGLTTPQVIRTADMVQAHCVLITSGKNVPEITVSLARESNITLLQTKYPNFEACVKIGDSFRDAIG